MIDRDLDLTTAEGAMTTFVTHPEEGGPHPVVLFYMDAPGKREELHDMARRLGSAGYDVALPNLYHRDEREFDSTLDPARLGPRALELMDTLDFDRIASDTRALFDLVDTDPAADATQIGPVGYCMSGPFAYAVAGMFPDRIRAAASFYGVRLHGKRSPQHLTADVRGELYFGCAELDEWAPKDMIDQLEAHLRELGTNARVEWYPGARHGFAFPSRQGAYDKASCERHWERLHALFDRNLR